MSSTTLDTLGSVDPRVTRDLPMTHLRDHVGFTAEHVQIDATERNQDGTVNGRRTDRVRQHRGRPRHATAVRAFAADLLEAADVLDRTAR